MATRQYAAARPIQLLNDPATLAGIPPTILGPRDPFLSGQGSLEARHGVREGNVGQGVNGADPLIGNVEAFRDFGRATSTIAFEAILFLNRFCDRRRLLGEERTRREITEHLLLVPIDIRPIDDLRLGEGVGLSLLD